jgi:diaminopimelate decarboxylase
MIEGIDMKWWEREGFRYKEGRLCIQSIDFEEIAKRFGTPLYVYDGNRFLENARNVHDSLEKYADRDIRVQFMMKSNPSLGLLGVWNRHGYKYVSVSSPFEARLALKAGIKPEYITWVAGIGVGDKEFRELKNLGINITIDSMSQLKRIRSLGIKEISIRWNPGLGMGKIPAAGKRAHGQPMQFGIPKEDVSKAFEYAKDNGIEIRGIAQHVGSQIIEKEETKKYFRSMEMLIEMTKELEDSGFGLEYICFGGGISVPYTKNDAVFPIESLAKNIFQKIKSSGIKANNIVIEPGRYLTADMGILIAKVNLVEKKQGNVFIGIDAGVNLVPRVLFHKRYQTPHEIVPCKIRRGKTMATVCGTLLFTGDNFGTQEISRVYVGDYLTFLNMGAYNPSFQFHFGWPFAKEILIFNKKACEIRKEETFADYARDQLLVD